MVRRALVSSRLTSIVSTPSTATRSPSLDTAAAIGSSGADGPPAEGPGDADGSGSGAMSAVSRSHSR